MYIEVKSIVWCALIFSLPESTINTSIYLRIKYLCIYHPLSTINQCLFLSYFEINCKKVLAFSNINKTHFRTLYISLLLESLCLSELSGIQGEAQFCLAGWNWFFFPFKSKLNQPWSRWQCLSIKERMVRSVCWEESSFMRQHIASAPKSVCAVEELLLKIMELPLTNFT